MIKNRTIFTADNLPIMRGMNSESVDLIYLDPPFNSDHNYAAPIGSKAAGAEFKDTWTLSDIDDAWHDEIQSVNPDVYSVIETAGLVGGKSNKAYLIYMAVRLLEMKRILKSTGSFYLHCDPTMSHSLKLMLDSIFGKAGFRNEIVWCYKSRPQSKNYFGKKHDVLLFYTMSDDYLFNWEKISRPLSAQTIEKYRHKDKDGRLYRLQGRGISGSPIRSAKDVQLKWEKEHPELVVRDYLDEKMGVVREDWWPDINIINQSAKERTGYPTQKPLALLERIIDASSNRGDIVFDPFCGCATTCVAAEKLQRQWIGIDISPKAFDLVKDRLQKEVQVGDYALLGDVIHRQDMPKRTDQGKLPAPKIHKKALYGEQSGNCAACKEHFQARHFHIDHIIPQAKGGTDHKDNLQLLCGNCNSIKGDRDMLYLMSQLEQKGFKK